MRFSLFRLGALFGHISNRFWLRKKSPNRPERLTKSLKKGESVSLVGFGTFKISNRSARVGRNPRTGEEIKIKASKSPRFSAGKGLKEAVN